MHCLGLNLGWHYETLKKNNNKETFPFSYAILKCCLCFTQQFLMAVLAKIFVMKNCLHEPRCMKNSKARKAKKGEQEVLAENQTNWTGWWTRNFLEQIYREYIEMYMEFVGLMHQEFSERKHREFVDQLYLEFMNQMYRSYVERTYGRIFRPVICRADATRGKVREWPTNCWWFSPALWSDQHMELDVKVWV